MYLGTQVFKEQADQYSGNSFIPRSYHKQLSSPSRHNPSSRSIATHLVKPDLASTPNLDISDNLLLDDGNDDDLFVFKRYNNLFCLLHLLSSTRGDAVTEVREKDTPNKTTQKKITLKTNPTTPQWRRSTSLTTSSGPSSRPA